MKIEIAVSQYKLKVLSNEGIELLRASGENDEFYCDVDELIRAFAGQVMSAAELDRKIRQQRADK